MHPGDPQAVAGDADVRTRPSSRAVASASSAPPGANAVSHSSSSTRLCSWIRSTWSTPSRSSERRARRGRVAACARRSWWRGRPRRDARRATGCSRSSDVAVRRGGVDVVDAPLVQRVERGVGALLAHAAERGGAEDHSGRVVPGRTERRGGQRVGGHARDRSAGARHGRCPDRPMALFAADRSSYCRAVDISELTSRAAELVAKRARCPTTRSSDASRPWRPRRCRTRRCPTSALRRSTSG